MHVFLTGATGFIGHHLLRELLAAGHTVRCLVREGSLEKLPVGPEDVREVDSDLLRVAASLEAREAPAPPAPVEVVYGDVTEIDSIQGDLSGCEAVVHLVGIIEEERPRGLTFERVHVRGTRAVVEEARAAGIERFVLMSANGARTGEGASAYQRTKAQAEAIVREAGFPHAVILRPSIVFGDPGEGRPEFATRLADTLVRPFPVVPILGDGQYRIQPVHVSVVARAFVQALTLEVPAGEARAYCLGGPEALTFDEIVDRIALGMGRRPRPKLHLPMLLARALVGSLGRLGLLPISPTQFQMLTEGNTCEDDRFLEDFEVEAIPFTPEHLGHLR